MDYYAAARAALGLLPTQKHLVFERFFDETGGTQLLIHSPFGSRINRAWGLSLRKRFCRKFNFELQAAATEDAIILSLTATHSFQLEEVARYLHSNSVRTLLVQALLDAPMFMTRWRWNASIALALLRFRGGNKVPPQLQRMEAEDLIAAVFPDQLACQENIVGDREIPDHPLVNQTISDCLHEAMDIDGMERLLRSLESGEIDSDRLQSHRTLSARAGSAGSAALCLPRRCPAGGAPHPGRHRPALARSRQRRRHRPARSRCHRPRARGSLAQRGGRQTSCTTHCCGLAT